MSDDYLATTGTTGIITLGSDDSGSAIGRIETGWDHDWFKVTLTAGQKYLLGVETLATAGLVDPYLWLRDATGALIDANDDSGSGLNALLRFVPPTSGAYFLDAGAYGTGLGGYLVTVSRDLSIPDTTTDDHGASASTAGAVAVGDSTRGQIETSADRDWYAVTLITGQRYAFGLTTPTVGGLADPLLSIYSSAGALLAYNDDGNTGVDSLLFYAPSVAGTYYLEARDYGIGTGTYILSARVAAQLDTVAPTVISFSPADEAAAVSVSGNIVLTFSETIQRGTGNIMLKTAGGALIEGYDASASARLSLSGATLTLDPTAVLANGTEYRLEFGAGSIKDLASNAYAGTSIYNFTTAPAPAATDDYAGNRSTTGRLFPGSSVNGNIEVSGDRDWFAITLSAGQSYAFSLNANIPVGLADPFLALYDAAGTLLLSNDDGGTATNSLITYTPPTSGTFYLEARDYGIGLGTYSLGVSGSAPPDTTAPIVLSFSPADDSASALVTDDIVVTFDEPVQRGSGFILLKTDSGAVVESYDAGTSTRMGLAGGVLTLDPSVTLAGASAYRVEFAPGTLRDFAGNAYAGTTSYNFSTVGDTSPPTVISFTPADEASAVALDSNIVVNFDESIQRGTGTILLVTAAGSVVESFDAGTSARLSMSGAVLTLDPSAALASGSGYRVEFSPGTVADLAGNGYGGTTSYNFTTLTTTSADDFAGNTTTTGRLAAGGSANGRIETANDRDWFAIPLNTGQIYTFTLDGTVSDGLSDPYLTLFSSAGTYLAYDDDGGSYYGSRLVYSPAATGTYYLGASHYGSGIGAYTLRASSANLTDTTAPTVVSFSPADETSAVSLTSNIVLTFSENIERGTGTIALKTSAGMLVESFDAASSTRLNVVGATLTLDPAAALASDTGYRVEFAAGNIRDLAGNPYAGTTTYNFSTQGDNTAPTVIRFSPADEATSVAVGSNIVVTFSESIQRGAGAVVLKTAAGMLVESFDVASSARLSLSGATLTLDPTSTLANGTGYRVEFAAGNIKDLAGNAYAGAAAYNFTTVAAASADDHAANTSTTGRIAVGASASGRIETVNDRDWFSVSLTAGQTYTFRLNAATTNGLDDPYLSLYGATGALLAANDDGDTGYNSLLSYTAESAGTFYLEARHYGSGTGAYTLLASADAASTPGTSGFSIAINYSGAPAYRRYFDEAAVRWAQIITGDLPDVSSSRGVIDDLLVDASVAAIDGVGNVLGQAGYTAIRGGGLPYLGVMEFDEADITRLVTNGTFGSVVLHEMGHVLGLSGYLWQQRGLVSTANPYLYTGANAVAAYDSLTAATPVTVPLESGGGSGTAGSHWSEAVFNGELMTGYAESAPPMPISIITIGALADLGYRVNYALADAFSL